MPELTIKTSDELLERMSKSAAAGLTEDEIREQRVSFIFAGMPKNSGMSKVEIAKSISKSS